MKTLADFKRALTVGSLWTRKHVNDSEPIDRIVAETKTNGVFFTNLDGTQGAWLYFPKASEFQINEAGEAEIYYPASYDMPRRLILTYKQV